MIFGTKKSPAGPTYQASYEFGLQCIVEEMGVDKFLVLNNIPFDDPEFEIPSTQDLKAATRVKDAISERFEIEPTRHRIDIVSDELGWSYVVTDLAEAPQYRTLNLEAINKEVLKEEIRSKKPYRFGLLPQDFVSHMSIELASIWYCDRDLVNEFGYVNFGGIGLARNGEARLYYPLELLSVAMGFGAFLANEAESRKEFNDACPAMDIGSIMGLVQFAKGQNGDPVDFGLESLREDAATCWKKTIKYLKSVDSYFGPKSISQQRAQASVGLLESLLESSRNVDRIIAFLFLFPRIQLGAVSDSAMLGGCNDKDLYVRRAAAYCLADHLHHLTNSYERYEVSAAVKECLIQLSVDKDEEIRIAALHGLEVVQVSDVQIRDQCRALLKSNAEEAVLAAWSLKNYRASAETIVPVLGKSILRFLAKGDYAAVQDLIYALCKLSDHPEHVLARVLENDIDDFLLTAFEIVNDVREQIANESDVSNGAAE